MKPAWKASGGSSTSVALRGLATDLGRNSRSGDPAGRAVRTMLAQDIERYLTRPATAATAPSSAPGAPPELPPGPPIGAWNATEECAWTAIAPPIR